MAKRAVIFDVGGVMLVPDATYIESALARRGIAFSPADPVSSHYHGIHNFDSQDGTSFWSEYSSGYLKALGVFEHELDLGTEALQDVWDAPAIDTWSVVLPDVVDTLRRLTVGGIPFAVVSNADGTIEQSLLAKQICQVGAGAGSPVVTVVDSGVVGVAKPDPRIFDFALEALGVKASDALYLGDSERIDVLGAKRAGLHPVHVDPLELCRNRGDHTHIATFREIDRLL